MRRVFDWFLLGMIAAILPGIHAVEVAKGGLTGGDGMLQRCPGRPVLFDRQDRLLAQGEAGVTCQQLPLAGKGIGSRCGLDTDTDAGQCAQKPRQMRGGQVQSGSDCGGGRRLQQMVGQVQLDCRVQQGTSLIAINQGGKAVGSCGVLHADLDRTGGHAGRIDQVRVMVWIESGMWYSLPWLQRGQGALRRLEVGSAHRGPPAS